jgi:hypothetical protein
MIHPHVNKLHQSNFILILIVLDTVNVHQGMCLRMEVLDGNVLHHSRPLVSSCGAPVNSTSITVTVHPGGETASAPVIGGCFIVALKPRPSSRSVSDAVTLALTLENSTSPFTTAYGVLFGHPALCEQERERQAAQKPTSSLQNIKKITTEAASKADSSGHVQTLLCPPEGFSGRQITNGSGSDSDTHQLPTVNVDGVVPSNSSFGYPSAIPRHIHQTWSGYDLPCPSRWAEVIHCLVCLAQCQQHFRRDRRSLSAQLRHCLS